MEGFGNTDMNFKIETLFNHESVFVTEHRVDALTVFGGNSDVRNQLAAFWTQQHKKSDQKWITWPLKPAPALNPIMF